MQAMYDTEAQEPGVEGLVKVPPWLRLVGLVRALDSLVYLHRSLPIELSLFRNFTGEGRLGGAAG